MNEIERRFGWRLEKVYNLIKKKDYKKAFDEYSRLIKLFNCLHGYEDEERINFYNKIKFVGDNFLFKLAKKKVLNKIEKHKFSKNDFHRRLKELTKENTNDEICHLIKKEKFEKVLKKYENR